MLFLIGSGVQRAASGISFILGALMVPRIVRYFIRSARAKSDAEFLGNFFDGIGKAVEAPGQIGTEKRKFGHAVLKQDGWNWYDQLKGARRKVLQRILNCPDSKAWDALNAKTVGAGAVQLN